MANCLRSGYRSRNRADASPCHEVTVGKLEGCPHIRDQTRRHHELSVTATEADSRRQRGADLAPGGTGPASTDSVELFLALCLTGTNSGRKTCIESSTGPSCM